MNRALGLHRPVRTVLVFAYECAPYNQRESTIGAQRPAQFAKYLPAHGWRAIVLCCDASRRGEGMSPALADEVRSRLAGPGDYESVVIPLPSLPHDGVLDRAWRALVPRPGVADSRRRAVFRKPLTAAKLLTGDHSQAWQPCARVAARVAAETMRVDACLAEHSPDAGLFLARWFAREHDVPWIADFRDPILQPHVGIMRRIYAPVARRLLRDAARTINVTPVWAERDTELTGRPSVMIPNGFDPDEFAAIPDRPAEQFTIAFTGNVWREMRPDLLFSALAPLRAMLAPEELTQVRVEYRGGAHAMFENLAERFGVSDLVSARPPVPRDEALRLMRRASVLLLLSIDPDATSDSYLTSGIYPGKTFEYFGAGRPILCVPGDRGVLDALLRETGTGTSLADPDAIARWLAEAYRQWRTRGAVSYTPDEARVAGFTREASARRLAAVLDEAVSAA